MVFSPFTSSDLVTDIKLPHLRHSQRYRLKSRSRFMTIRYPYLSPTFTRGTALFSPILFAFCLQVSRWRHPQDFVAPFRRFIPEIFRPFLPHAQSQYHSDPELLVPAYPVTVNLPNTFPVRSIRLGNVDTAVSIVRSRTPVHYCDRE